MLRGTALDGGGLKPAAPGEAIVDLALLSDILGDPDADEMREHFDLFFSHFPSLMDRLDAALARGNDADIASTAHTAMGAAGMAAAVRLRGLLTRIEVAARAGEAPTVSDLVPSVRPEYARVVAFVAAGGLNERPD